MCKLAVSGREEVFSIPCLQVRPSQLRKERLEGMGRRLRQGHHLATSCYITGTRISHNEMGSIVGPTTPTLVPIPSLKLTVRGPMKILPFFPGNTIKMLDFRSLLS